MLVGVPHFYKKNEQAQRACYHYLRLYFFLKRSTRPPTFTIFCLPVKKGWQAEQTSTRKFSAVDPVSNEFPHAQVIVVSLYFG